MASSVRSVTSAAAAALAATLMLAPLGAQTPRPGMITGRIADTSGAPLADVSVRATQGARTVFAESNKEGVYRLTGLDGGAWVLSVRRLGFVPALDTVTMRPEGERHDVVLRAHVVTLDPVLVTEGWRGVQGVVGDARYLTPLTGASVGLVGQARAVRTDAAGRFAIPATVGDAVLLLVEVPGYAHSLVSLTVPASGYIELDVALDTLRDGRANRIVLGDLEQRLRFATPNAGFVNREELARMGSTSLLDALLDAPSLARKGIVVTRAACLFVDGVARPGMPVDLVSAGMVEFVEVYPARTELSNTLARRWPPRAVCGAPGGATRGATSSQTARFVSVWTRTQ